MNTNGASANQYAQAIMQAMMERWQSSLATVTAQLQQNPQLLSMLANSGYDLNERLGALGSVIPNDAPPELQNTLKVMVEEGTIGLVDQLGSALAQVASGHSAPKKASVTSAVALSAEEQEQLRRSLLAQYGDDLVFDFAVDPSLMGGLRVRVGDRLIDTSVATRLQAMRETLSAAVR
ncbi:MAG: ATP synthase F1 subunit delta [Caldilineaceae bacterium]